MFSKKKDLDVLCIGSTSLDIFFPTDEGCIIETPEDITSQKKIAFELGGKVLVPEIHTAIGGVSANVSIGLARLGVKSGCYSCLGADSNGSFCSQELESNRVNIARVQKFTDARTDLSAIVVLLPGGERTIIHNRDANKRLAIIPQKLGGQWIFVSALNGDWKKNIETLLQTYHKRKGEKEAFKIAFNPGQHNIKEDSAFVFELIRYTDVLVLNKDEALELILSKNKDISTSELQSEVYLLKMLHQAGSKIVALTDGKRGAWVYNGKECWLLQASQSVEVIDTTGAGDAFTSGFLGGYIKEKTLDQCLRYGMANSHAVIQKYGAATSLLHEEDMEKAILHLIPHKLP